MERIYVAYGSNLDLTQMANRCKGAEIRGIATLKNYRLMFKGELPNSYATVEEWEGYEVPVLLWTLDEVNEKRLDRYEGYPRHYLKKTVEVEFADGGTLEGFIYYKPEEESLNLPQDHYYAVIYNAYETLNFDWRILEEAYCFSDKHSRLTSCLFKSGIDISDEDA